MKIIAPTLVALLLSACSTIPAPQVNISNLEASNAVTLQDMRPEEEHQREIYSYLITSDQYGLSRIGDIAMQPSAERLLRHRAFEKLHNTEPANIKIYHFVVYSNFQKLYRSEALGASFGGLLGALIVSYTDTNALGQSFSIIDPNEFKSFSGENEWKRALLTAQENTDAAYITWLDADINGKRTFVRGVSPFKVPEGKNPYVMAVESTFDFFLKQY